MLEELAARAGLHAALANRAPQQLLPLLQHLTRHITDPRHSQVLAGVAARVLDLYATSVHADPEVRVCGGLFGSGQGGRVGGWVGGCVYVWGEGVPHQGL